MAGEDATPQERSEVAQALQLRSDLRDLRDCSAALRLVVSRLDAGAEVIDSVSLRRAVDYLTTGVRSAIDAIEGRG